VQFHPEFKSTPWNGHPLFNAYIAATLEQRSTTSQALEADLPTPLKAVA